MGILVSIRADPPSAAATPTTRRWKSCGARERGRKRRLLVQWIDVEQRGGTQSATHNRDDIHTLEAEERGGLEKVAIIGIDFLEAIFGSAGKM